MSQGLGCCGWSVGSACVVETAARAREAGLDAAGYGGSIILETTAPIPDPFSPDTGPGFRNRLSDQLARSAAALRAMGA